MSWWYDVIYISTSALCLWSNGYPRPEGRLQRILHPARNDQWKDEAASLEQERARTVGWSNHSNLLVAMGCTGCLCLEPGVEQLHVDHVWTHRGRYKLLLQRLQLLGELVVYDVHGDVHCACRSVFLAAGQVRPARHHYPGQLYNCTGGLSAAGRVGWVALERGCVRVWPVRSQLGRPSPWALPHPHPLSVQLAIDGQGVGPPNTRRVTCVRVLNVLWSHILTYEES